VAAAISSGYLLAPIDGQPLPRAPAPLPIPKPVPTAKTKSPRPPPPQPPVAKTLVPSAKQISWESRAKALQARAKFHAEQEERYRRAIYQPWMRLGEEEPPTVPAAPK